MLNIVSSPILYRFFYLLTPQSELPALPKAVKNYWGVHIYTSVQILVTVVIFIVTLTKGAPAFPVLIIALVPIRLLVMNKIWHRETLRFVDAWACREGTPEDDEDAEARSEEVELQVMEPNLQSQDVVKQPSEDGIV
jgi:hypothetical protein